MPGSIKLLHRDWCSAARLGAKVGHVCAEGPWAGATMGGRGVGTCLCPHGCARGTGPCVHQRCPCPDAFKGCEAVVLLAFTLTPTWLRCVLQEGLLAWSSRAQSLGIPATLVASQGIFMEASGTSRCNTQFLLETGFIGKVHRPADGRGPQLLPPRPGVFGRAAALLVLLLSLVFESAQMPLGRTGRVLWHLHPISADESNANSSCK